MSLVMVLSQQDAISKGGLFMAICDLHVHGQVEDHVTKMTHVIEWIL